MSSAISSFLNWQIENGISTCLLAIVVACSCWWLRNRPAVQHALWVVVLVKFLMPPVIAWPWSVGDMVTWSKSLTLAVNRPPERPRMLDSDNVSDVEDFEGALAEAMAVGAWPKPASATLTDREEVESRTAGAGGLGSAFTARLVIPLSGAIWCLGVVVISAIQCRRIWRHAVLIHGSAPAPRHLAVEVDRISAKLGSRPIRAVVAGSIASPFVWCLGWLRLVWPQSLSSAEGVVRSRGIIAHELAHLRRGDHWVSWLELAAGLIWWWNPVFWLVRRRLRECAELACDAVAIGAFPSERRAYAELFLELSSPRVKTGCRCLSWESAPAPLRPLKGDCP